jgi:uncharacterized membrane protein
MRPPPGLPGQMAMIGRLHPLLIHFPIALVIVAVAAESASVLRKHSHWRVIAVGNLRAAAVFALLAAVAGWRLAAAGDVEATALLEWHRWLGTAGAVATVAAAATTWLDPKQRSPAVWIYRITLLGAAGLVAIAGHLGGLLVWGGNYFRP